MKVKQHPVYDFLEPSGAMALAPRQLDSSHDNSILESVIAYYLFPFLGHDWIAKVLRERRIEPGFFKRHPHEYFPTLQDDLIAVVCMGNGWATEVLDYGQKHFWLFSDRGGFISTYRAYGVAGTLTRWLGRFGSLWATAHIISDRKASILYSITLSLYYLSNSFLSRSDTSGRRLLWIIRESLFRFRTLSVWNPLSWSISFWECRMNKIHPDGPRDMFTVYHYPCLRDHGVVHPFVLYSERSW